MKLSTALSIKPQTRWLLAFGLLVLSACFLVSSSLVSAAPVQEPSGPGPVITKIVAKCKKIVPDSLEKACTEDMARGAENAASNECSNNDTLEDCLVKTATGYINDAYNQDPKPKTAAQLNNNLKEIYQARGVDPTKFDIGSLKDPAVDCTGDSCGDFVGKYINPAINLFSVAFGLIAVASLIFGAIQFSASEGDPQKASNAKKRILNTIIALVAYIFLYAFIQFLVPGGVFQ